MSISIESAQPEDEAELRALEKEISMPGAIRLSYTREPNFFDSLQVMARKNEVVVARNSDNNIVGYAVRSIKSVYINGALSNVGYLSNLRLLNKYRGNSVLARGFKYLNHLHQDNQCSFYLTTIMSDNKIATDVLLSGRAGLPAYKHWGKFRTYLINDTRQSTPISNFDVDLAKTTDTDELISFLQAEGKKKQFFPHYEKNDLAQKNGLLRDLAHQSILVAKQHEKIVGTLALWDQRSFKQILVNGYHPVLQLIKPLYNFYLKLRNRPCLVEPGYPIDFNYAALVCVKDNDLRIFHELVSAAVSRTKKHHKSFFALGLHERDVLNEAMSGFSYRLLTSELYLVNFSKNKVDYDSLKKSVPYLELGAL